jgi:hypothetical protein
MSLTRAALSTLSAGGTEALVMCHTVSSKRFHNGLKWRAVSIGEHASDLRDFRVGLSAFVDDDEHTGFSCVAVAKHLLAVVEGA